MQIFRVGGSVRDELLGHPSADDDFVVVGSTPEQMIELGFRAVGQDFPVFVDPQSGAEYALARTERRSGRGHRGFTFHADRSVTLEQDLARRDLSINAMARDVDGALIDPYGGQRDLAAGVLRHVSPAFAEDPLRVMRVARFAARFGFDVAPETEALMRHMVAAGDLGDLTPERVWQELARGLMSATPSRMLQVLRECGALRAILPEVDRLFGVPQPVAHHPEIDSGVHTLQAIDYAARAGFPLASRFAALVHDLGKAETPAAKWPRHIAHEGRGAALAQRVSERLRVPLECRDAGRSAAETHLLIQRVLELRPATLLDLLRRIDALRRPERLQRVVEAAEADVMSRPGDRPPFGAARQMREARDAVAALDLAAVAARHAGSPDLPQRIRQAQSEALAAWRRGVAAPFSPPATPAAKQAPELPDGRPGAQDPPGVPDGSGEAMVTPDVRNGTPGSS